MQNKQVQLLLVKCKRERDKYEMSAALIMLKYLQLPFFSAGKKAPHLHLRGMLIK